MNSNFEVLVSSTAQRQYSRLPEDVKERVKEALSQLKDDPFTSRPRADIKEIKGSVPKKYRLRIGEYRAIYAVEGDKVKVIEIFSRGRGYRFLV